MSLEMWGFLLIVFCVVFGFSLGVAAGTSVTNEKWRKSQGLGAPVELWDGAQYRAVEIFELNALLTPKPTPEPPPPLTKIIRVPDPKVLAPYPESLTAPPLKKTDYASVEVKLDGETIIRDGWGSEIRMCGGSVELHTPCPCRSKST